MDGKVSWLVVCWVTMLNGSVLLCLLQRCGISPSLRPALAGCSQVATNATQPVTCFPLRVQSSTADGPRALISAGTFSLLWRGRGRGAWVCATGGRSVPMEKEAYLTETWETRPDHTVTEYS